MMFDGRLVKDSSFTYADMEDFISGTDHKTRQKKNLCNYNMQNFDLNLYNFQNNN